MKSPADSAYASGQRGRNPLSRAAIFLDRDGVINELVPDPYSGRPESPLLPEDVRVIPGAAAGIRRLRAAGYVLVGVTNQPAAAKELVSVEELLEVHARLVSLLANEGAGLDDWRICLHHPEGRLPELSISCECRKPNPGLLLAAAGELSLDLPSSWMIGDTDSDVVAGQAVGMRTILIEHGPSSHKRRGTVTPSCRAASLAKAAAQIPTNFNAGRDH